MAKTRDKTLDSMFGADDAPPPAVVDLRAPLDGRKSKPTSKTELRHITGFRLTNDVKKALAEAKVDDGIPRDARVQALIELWVEDDELRERVRSRAAANSLG